MTPYIAIPHRTSQRAHTAAGHVARVKSAATGRGTTASLRSALVSSKLAREGLAELEREIRTMIKNGEKK